MAHFRNLCVIYVIQFNYKLLPLAISPFFWHGPIHYLLYQKINQIHRKKVISGYFPILSVILLGKKENITNINFKDIAFVKPSGAR